MASTAPARRTTDVPESLLAVGARAEARIAELLDREATRWAEVDPALAEPIEALRTLVLSGGKRLRPAFCEWAFVGAGGAPASPVAVDAGAGLAGRGPPIWGRRRHPRRRLRLRLRGRALLGRARNGPLGLR